MKPTPLTIKKRLALELWRQQENLARREHPLRQLFWECTLRCDLKCRHCGSDCKMKTDGRDMPKEDFLRVLDSIAAKTDPHKVFVIVSGGEPLMRQDIEECGREIYGKGFPWGMVTNALHLTPQRWQRLLQAGIHTMSISLDGLEEDHNWMRGNSRSFSMVSHAIDMLVATKGFVFDIVTCVNRRNYGKLDEIKEFLIGKGVGRWRIFTVFPVGRAALDPQMRLTNEEFRGVFEYIRRTREEGRIRVDYGCEGFLGNYEGEVRNRLFACQAGVTVGSVMADGAIAACASIRADYNQGNIYRDDFMEVWEHRYAAYRQREWMRNGECDGCKYFRYCQGNGMHLRDGDGRLLLCHLHRLEAE
ncbi:MAG: TIGR04133 family radical SAM/SPASM protein [Prevotella sp.]|jgi:radical SAM enzyme (rSAM/lipoprotein system)|nr:TIGR04133 family radical SAM/SPASM protein [Prevotella sp.]